MKDIRLRAWDEKRNCMMYHLYAKCPPKGVPQKNWHVGMQSHGFEVSEYEGKGYWRQFPIMLFTGLLDKNGKEIYDGDIIRLRYKNGFMPLSIRAKIERHEGGFWFQGIDRNITDCNWHFYNQSEREVIGNIYENKELLEG